MSYSPCPPPELKEYVDIFTFIFLSRRSRLHTKISECRTNEGPTSTSTEVQRVQNSNEMNIVKQNKQCTLLDVSDSVDAHVSVLLNLCMFPTAFSGGNFRQSPLTESQVLKGLGSRGRTHAQEIIPSELSNLTSTCI